jgi:hypothetical protein
MAHDPFVQPLEVLSVHFVTGARFDPADIWVPFPSSLVNSTIISDVRESEYADLSFLEEMGRECVRLYPKKVPWDKLLLAFGIV